jgi:multiple sugar transport system ATP-binding protein
VADIAIRGVTKSYDGRTAAVDAVDLDVADGELLVLVGPSGCGKSTLLRMIAGLEEVTEGSIAIGGDDVTRRQPKDRDIAMVFQSYALYPHMSVARNIGYPLKLAKTPRDEITRRVAEVAEVLQLTEVLGRTPSQLSGGQRQRVAMGRAIIRHPRVFLMDEPLSNLDAKLRVEMRAEIARLQRELAVTTVYVTHDQTEAMTMGTRVAVLRDGRLQQVDTPQQLYDEPVNLFVATFIGSPAMNLFAGTVEAAPSGGVSDAPAVRVGGQRLVLDEAVVAAHPRVRELRGSPVIVGIRPESFSDPAAVSDRPEAVGTGSGAPAGRGVDATVDLVESLGAELVVHLEVTEPPPLGAEPSESWRQVVARKGRGVARLGTRSLLAAGDRVTLAVDTAALHLFDIATGESLRGPGEPSARVAPAAAPGRVAGAAGTAGARPQPAGALEVRHAGEAAEATEAAEAADV